MLTIILSNYQYRQVPLTQRFCERPWFMQVKINNNKSTPKHGQGTTKDLTGKSKSSTRGCRSAWYHFESTGETSRRNRGKCEDRSVAEGGTFGNSKDPEKNP